MLQDIPGIEPRSSALQVDSYQLSRQGSQTRGLGPNLAPSPRDHSRLTQPLACPPRPVSPSLQVGDHAVKAIISCCLCPPDPRPFGPGQHGPGYSVGSAPATTDHHRRPPSPARLIRAARTHRGPRLPASPGGHPQGTRGPEPQPELKSPALPPRGCSCQGEGVGVFLSPSACLHGCSVCWGDGGDSSVPQTYPCGEPGTGALLRGVPHCRPHLRREEGIHGGMNLIITSA